MTRTITTVTTSVTTLDAYRDDTDLRTWLADTMATHDLRWLLAYADDAVIWGERRDGALATSDQVFAANPPAGTLRPQTLQRVHIFGDHAEVLLRRAEGGWRATLRQDGSGTPSDYFDEGYLLWGTKMGDTRAGFVELIEGARGIRHTPPMIVAPNSAQRGSIRVRHYLDQDPATGLLRVGARRLVALQGAR